MQRNLGSAIMLAGAGIVVVGLLVGAGAFSWLGRLPGDVRLQAGRTRVYVPLMSMLVVSLAGTILANLVIRLLR